MKNSNDTIGNRTRDLPASSAVSHVFEYMYWLYKVTFTNWQQQILCYEYITVSYNEYSNEINALNKIQLFIYTTTHCSLLRLIVRPGLDVPTFATRRLHTSPRESTQRRKVELWARNVR